MVYATRRIATVFGGSGMIGRGVVSRLARQGFVVRIAVRDPERAAALRLAGEPGQIVPVLAPVERPEAVARAVAGAEIVVNLAGQLAERRRGGLSAVMGQGAGHVGRAAAAAGARGLVHLSAIGADPAGPTPYARAKAEGEAAVRAAFPAAVILRPSVVFGAGDRFFNQFGALARTLPVVPVVRGACRLQPVWEGDVVSAVLAALAREDARGKTFELAGPRVASVWELAAWALAVTGRRRRLWAMPEGLFRLGAALAEMLPGQMPLRAALDLLGRDNVAGGELPGLAALGVTATPMEAVVPGYLRGFAEGGRASWVRFGPN